jgi:pilus assembly protein Flp/PilA
MLLVPVVFHVINRSLTLVRTMEVIWNGGGGGDGRRQRRQKQGKPPAAKGRLMKKRLQKLAYVVTNKSGQGLVEYALILVLISVVAVLILQGLGTHVNNTLSTVNSNLL